MGTVKRFEDLEIWQLARELLNLIYDDFRNCKDYSFKNQNHKLHVLSKEVKSPILIDSEASR